MKIVKTILKVIGTLVKVSVLISGINMIFSFIEGLLHHNIPEGGRFYVWKHGKIFYHVKGDGAPILVIHGLEPHQSGRELDALSNHLASTHTVYRIDLLGFGLSDKPWFTYTNYLYVQLIQNFIHDVIEKPCDILAYGGSGLCALQANKTDPSMIEKLILLDPLFEVPMPYKGAISDVLRKVIDYPIIGTFLFNLYSLTGKAPFDKEGRHVFTSRFSGYLTSSIAGHEDLITDKVTVLSHDMREEETYSFREMDSALI